MAIEHQALEEVKQELEERFILSVVDEARSAESGTNTHGFENITGVGISHRIRDHKDTDEPCVTVYVAEKVRRDTILPAAMVPDKIKGVSIDVVETGEFVMSPYKGKYRPAPGGVSIGHIKISAGTLGCLVKRGKTQYILSNNHVLANSNDAKIGDPITQPGPLDGGTAPQDVIAKLSEFVPILFNGGANYVDCAIAEPTDTKFVVPENKCFGRISDKTLPALVSMKVKKCGRTTQFTQGHVRDVNFTGRVHYGAETAIFRNQIMIVSGGSKPFSQGGDSGSLILHETENRPVGLLFAGSDTHTLANPIDRVLRSLNVTIVS